MSYPVVLPGKCILRNQEVEETVPTVKTPNVMGGVKDSHPLLENISKHQVIECQEKTTLNKQTKIRH